MELGEAVLLLMADTDTEAVAWTHRVDSPVVWLDAPVRSWRTGIRDLVDHWRVGVLRVHVQGQQSKVLLQRMSEVWWVVSLEAEGRLINGVQTLTLRPGGGGARRKRFATLGAPPPEPLRHIASAPSFTIL